MSFSSGAPTPITAGGAAAEYTHKFKKHFGDRPTAFALSSRSSTSTTALAHTAARSTAPDPFAASTSSHPRSVCVDASNPPVPAYHTESFGAAQHGMVPNSSSSYHTENFGAAPAGLNSPASASVGPGLVDSETHSQLANLGWRIRARVNQGYTRSVTSHHDPFNSSASAFRTEREILSNVTNTRRGWSRTATAPTVSADFDGLRSTHGCDDGMRTRGTVECGPKRARSDSDEEQTAGEGEAEREYTGRRMANMPKLSFSTSSSASSVFSGRSLNRASSSINPFASTATIVDDEGEKAMAMDTDEEMHLDKPLAYDFSAHFNCTDF